MTLIKRQRGCFIFFAKIRNEIVMMISGKMVCKIIINGSKQEVILIRFTWNKKFCEFTRDQSVTLEYESRNHFNYTKLRLIYFFFLHRATNLFIMTLRASASKADWMRSSFCRNGGVYSLHKLPHTINAYHYRHHHRQQ